MPNFGTSGLQKEPGAVYKVDQSSFATYDKTYSGILVGQISFFQGDVAEEYPQTVLLSLTVTETGTACDHVKIDLHYEGKDITFSSEDLSKNISIDFTTSQEPIESHIDFCSLIGGTPTTPLHGAIFDKSAGSAGEFLGFPVIDPDEPDVTPSRFAGVRSYLMPQETYTVDTVEFQYPDSGEIENVGRVFTPDVNLPVLPGDRNWLGTGIRVQNIANVYFRQQVTGMLSGPRKWVPEIYGDGT